MEVVTAARFNVDKEAKKLLSDISGCKVNIAQLIIKSGLILRTAKFN